MKEFTQFGKNCKQIVKSCMEFVMFWTQSVHVFPVSYK